MNSGLSIVIPTYNEDKNLQLLISEIVKSTKIKNYEIIVADDNSTDKTYYIAQKLKKKYKNFNFYIRLNKIRDLSQSCILGFKKSKFQNILVMDADLQHNPKYINIFYRTFIKNNFDILIGCRELKKSLKLNSQFLRYLASNILVILFNKILGFKTIDPMSGFFLFKKKLFVNNKNRFFSRGYKILLDLIYNSNSNIKIKDFIINFDKRKFNKSKMNIKILILILFFLFIQIKKKLLIICRKVKN